MEKKIEDYLHLYLGCEVFDSFKFEEINYKRTHTLTIANFLWVRECINGGRHKLILRPLSDMTEEEANETGTWIHWTERNIVGQVSGYDAEQIRKMLSKHFDLFGLIESGLAIDKTRENKRQHLSK